MTFKSSLSVEFLPSELEEAQIVLAGLKARIAAIEVAAQSPYTLLSLATMIVDEGFKLRGAAARLDLAANDRVYGPKPRWDRGLSGPLEKPKARPSVDLFALGLADCDPEDILAAIEAVKGQKR